MKKLFIMFILPVMLCAAVCGAYAADLTAFDSALRAGSGTDAGWTGENDGIFEMQTGLHTVIRLYTDLNSEIIAMEVISSCSLEDDAAETGRELSRTARAAVIALYEADGLYTDATPEEVNSVLKMLLAPYSGSGEDEGAVMLAGREAVLSLSVSDSGTVYTLTVGQIPDHGPEASI
ncbi:MAG: hypothetical protein Q4G19_02520 [Clostridia bacterium]|nr:hypothetical protein [Clostridia bacterium]